MNKSPRAHGGEQMETMVVVALAVAIPIILFPAAFVWYLNLGGLAEAFKKVTARKTIVVRK